MATSFHTSPTFARAHGSHELRYFSGPGAVWHFIDEHQMKVSSFYELFFSFKNLLVSPPVRKEAFCQSLVPDHCTINLYTMLTNASTYCWILLFKIRNSMLHTGARTKHTLTKKTAVGTSQVFFFPPPERGLHKCSVLLLVLLLLLSQQQLDAASFYVCCHCCWCAGSGRADVCLQQQLPGVSGRSAAADGVLAQ